ncbi:hypothetical protein L1987_57203 [Smallanthus sonchifolius]|uniref:Uncharacterized protein n=1 Tax=Smallanthus sonchifolius TaxID=185202 RepID=A0ACB9DC13_9ASTR|nr:hypothetical protein L1987_57203 [Smallanthus sonchifolius]
MVMAPAKVNQAKIRKACKAMKPYGISAATVKSALKHLLKVYDSNWMYIEEDNYKVLLDFIIEPDGPKTMETVKNDFKLPDEDEEEETEPLKRKPRLRSQATSSSMYASEIIRLRNEDQKGMAPAGYVCENEETLLCLEYYNMDSEANKNEDENENEDVLPLKRKPEDEEETEPLKRKPRLRSQATSSTPAGDICENEEKLLALEYNNMDSEANKNEDENEEDVPQSPCSEIDIASSLNGEVKLTFSICKPPPGFRIPSIDAVMKHVEDTYQERIQGFGTRFSLSQLLKDICQVFMEQGNASDNVGNKIPPFDNFKEPEKQGGPTSEPIQIPRFVVSNEFDHCLSGKLRKQQMVGIDQLFFDNFKEPKKQGGPTNDPIQIPRFVVSSEFDRYFRGKLRKQHMVGIDELSGSRSLIIFPKEQSTIDLCSKRYCVADITLGMEKQEISLINEVDDEKPPTFTYIQTNFNYKTANVKFMLACISDQNNCPNCFGDCLSSEVPCACAVETGGEFAYTSEGLVDEKFLKNCIDITLKPSKKDYFYCDDCPLERMKKKRANQLLSGSCKGHLVRKFIKECWYKCGCGFNCGNRVVQRGIQAKFQYVGEIVTNSELFERNKQNENEEHTYPVLLDADWSSKARVTTREVKAMEELTWDYGIDFDDDSHLVKAFACKCGSKSCKAVKRYKRSRHGQDKQLIARMNY